MHFGILALRYVAVCNYVLSMVYPLFLLLQRLYCCFSLSPPCWLWLLGKKDTIIWRIHNTHTHTTFTMRCTSFSGTHTLAVEVRLSAVVNRIQFCWGFILYTGDCTQPSLLHS